MPPRSSASQSGDRSPVDQAAIREIVGQYRWPVERTKIPVTGIDHLDRRVQRCSGDHFVAIVSGGARRQITAEAKRDLRLDADEPQFPGLVGGRARANHLQARSERKTPRRRRAAPTFQPPTVSPSWRMTASWISYASASDCGRQLGGNSWMGAPPRAAHSRRAASSTVLSEHLGILGFELRCRFYACRHQSDSTEPRYSTAAQRRRYGAEYRRGAAPSRRPPMCRTASDR